MKTNNKRIERLWTTAMFFSNSSSRKYERFGEKKKEFISIEVNEEADRIGTESLLAS